MDAGKIYEVAIGAVMLSCGAMFVCIDFGLPPGSERMKKAREAMTLKRDHPLFFSLLGPIVLILGIAQILRQFHLF